METSFHQSDTAIPGTFDDIVELPPKFSASLTTEEGTEADNYMGYLDNGQKIFLGIQAYGTTINASPLVKHFFKITLPFFVTKPDPGDKNDVYGNTFNLDMAHDAAFGLFKAQLVNKLPGL